MLAQVPQPGTAPLHLHLRSEPGFLPRLHQAMDVFPRFVQAPCAVATGRAVADDDVVNAIVMAWNDLSP